MSTPLPLSLSIWRISPVSWLSTCNTDVIPFLVGVGVHLKKPRLHENHRLCSGKEHCFGCSRQPGRKPVFILTSAHAPLRWPLPSNTHPKCVRARAFDVRERKGGGGGGPRLLNLWASSPSIHPSIPVIQLHWLACFPPHHHPHHCRGGGEKKSPLLSPQLC